jgi:hypothetical protein
LLKDVGVATLADAVFHELGHAWMYETGCAGANGYPDMHTIRDMAIILDDLIRLSLGMSLRRHLGSEKNK